MCRTCLALRLYNAVCDALLLAEGRRHSPVTHACVRSGCLSPQPRRPPATSGALRFVCGVGSLRRCPQFEHADARALLYGWKGLLIEASPSNYHKLATWSNRTATLVHSAVCGAGGSGFVEISTAGGQFGGELGLIPAAARKRVTEASSSVARVPCSPLRSLMQAAGLTEGRNLSEPRR